MKRGVSTQGICGIAMQPSYPAPAPMPSPSPPPPPSPGNADYEDPNAGPCKSGEEAVQITGIQGSFCSPKCTGVIVKECPKNVPAGTTAQPNCVLETAGSSKPTQCALICDPSGSDKCPAKASCKSIQGT